MKCSYRNDDFYFYCCKCRRGIFLPSRETLNPNQSLEQVTFVRLKLCFRSTYIKKQRKTIFSLFFAYLFVPLSRYNELLRVLKKQTI